MNHDVVAFIDTRVWRGLTKEGGVGQRLVVDLGAGVIGFVSRDDEWCADERAVSSKSGFAVADPLAMKASLLGMSMLT